MANDPIYGDDGTRKGLETFGDAFTLGMGGFRQGTSREAATNELLGVPLPVYSQEKYQAPSYAGDFTPQLYQDPTQAKYQTVADNPQDRAAQMAALSRLQQFGDQAANSQEALGRYNAVSAANALAGQQQAGIRNQMAMRGQGGNGMEFVLQQQAGQDAANGAQNAAMNAAAQAALQRLAGTQAAYGAASDLRGQDFANASKNADIINAFNMHNTDALNAIRRGNTDLTNASGLRNLDARQGIMNAGTGAANANLDRSDRNVGAGFDARMQKSGGVANAMTGQAVGQQQQGEGWKNMMQMFMRGMGAGGA